MTQCEDCGKEMQESSTCSYDIIELDHRIYWRNTMHFGEDSGSCNDCGVKHGGIHHYGCDVERCPSCSGQLFSCDCRKGRIGKGRWKMAK